MSSVKLESSFGSRAPHPPLLMVLPAVRQSKASLALHCAVKSSTQGLLQHEHDAMPCLEQSCAPLMHPQWCWACLSAVQALYR